MRTLSAEHEAAAEDTVTQPGFLVEIQFDTALRLCSRGDVDAIGSSWTRWHVVVSGLSLSTRPGIVGNLLLGDSDQSLSALFLNAPVGVPIKVWRYDRAALEEDSNDVVLVFDGVCGALSGGPADRTMTVPLVSRETSTLYAPRRRMNSAAGFGTMPAAGKIYDFNGAKYRLEQER